MNRSLSQVLVTRPGTPGEALCHYLRERGLKVVYCPVIAFAPPPNEFAFESFVRTFDTQDWLIFVSPQAVAASLPMIHRTWPTGLPKRTQIAAIGESTAKKLQEAGFKVSAYPQNDWSSEGLLALPIFQRLENQKITLVKGEGGREILQQKLYTRGAQVSLAVAYQRILPQIDMDPFKKMLLSGEIDVIVCTSYEGVANLKLLIGEPTWQALKALPLIVVSMRIKKLAEKLGFCTIWVARDASDASIYDLIVQKGSAMSTESINTESNPPVKHSRWAKTGALLITFALLLFLAAFGYGYFQLAKNTSLMAREIATVEQKVLANEHTVARLNDTVLQFQSAIQKSKELAAQQARLIAEWQAAQQGNLQKWNLSQALYLVKLANEHLQFGYEVTQASLFLQRAQEILNGVQTPNIEEVRASLIADLQTVNSLPKTDTTAVFIRLSNVINQLDQLPLVRYDVQPKTDTLTTQPSSPEPQPWWRVGYHRFWDSLKQIVTVRHVDSGSLPLALPEEKMYLYQNLHAEIQNAIWGMLHQNATVYQKSLAQAIVWLERYYDKNNAPTIAVINELKALQQITIQVPTVKLDQTLQLLNAALSATPSAAAAPSQGA